jgi:hypothetical protein
MSDLSNEYIAVDDAMSHQYINLRHKVIREHTEDHHQLMQLKQKNESTADLVNKILNYTRSIKLPVNRRCNC